MAFLPFSQQARKWEPIAIELRRLAGVSDGELLDPCDLASKVGLRIIDAHFALEDFSAADKHHLLITARDHWSGGVLPEKLPDGSCICILNPNHPRRRSRITLLEEIVHMHRRHLPTRLCESVPGLRVRGYDRAQETEAYGVGAATLLPWSTFYHAVDTGTSLEEIGNHYDVTTQLVKYRIQITGAYRLYRSRCE